MYQSHDNIPETNYRVNGSTPVEWLVDRYKLAPDRESEIVNDPCENLTENVMISLVKRAVYVGIKSDEIVSELLKEFKPAEWMPKKIGLDAHMDMGGPVKSAL